MLKKQMRMLTLICLCVTAATSVTYSQIANQSFETKTILPPSFFQATDFRVADQTTVKGYEFEFNVETTYGNFPVLGVPLLERRISELRAIEKAIILSNKTVALK